MEFEHYNSVDRWTLLKYHVINEYTGGDNTICVRVGGRNGTDVLVCEKVPTKRMYELEKSYESSRDRSRNAIYKGVQKNDERKMEKFDRAKKESRSDTNDYQRNRSNQQVDRCYDDFKKPDYRRERSRSPVDYVMKSQPEYKEITRTIKLDARPDRYRPVLKNPEIESSTLVSEGSTYIRAKPIKSVKIEPAPLPPPAKSSGVNYRNPKHQNQGYPNQTQIYPQVQLKNETESKTEFKTELKTEFKNESYPKFIEIHEANAHINNILPVGPNTRVGLKDFYFNEEEHSIIVRKNDGATIKFLTKGINHIYSSVIEGRTALIFIFYQHGPELKDSKDFEQKKINGKKLAELCDFQEAEIKNNCLLGLWIECTREEPDLSNMLNDPRCVTIPADQMLQWQAQMKNHYKQHNPVSEKSDFEKSLEYSSYARTARENIEKLASDVNFMDNKKDCNGSAEDLIKFLKIGNLFGKSD